MKHELTFNKIHIDGLAEVCATSEHVPRLVSGAKFIISMTFSSTNSQCAFAVLSRVTVVGNIIPQLGGIVLGHICWL